jgi:phosphatidyl-myo-inositol alpha-mannosyltransferase
MKKLIIGLLIDDSLDDPKGVQNYVTSLGAELSKLGHEVHYICGDSSKSGLDNLHSFGKIARVSFNGNIVGTPIPFSVKKSEINKMYLSHSFDIIHVMAPYSPSLAHKVIMAAPSSCRIVCTFHTLPLGKMQALATKLYKPTILNSLKKIRSFVSVSAPAASYLKAIWGIESIVIPNMVDLASITNMTEISKTTTTANRKSIVFVGRLEHRKGPEYLVRAFAMMLDSSLDQDVELTIVGKGLLESNLKKLCIDLGVANKVIFAGYVTAEEKYRLLSNANVAVFPSLSGESFGIVLIEAMASGSRVVLAGDNPGYASVMRAEQLIAPKRVEDFSNTLARSLNDARYIEDCISWQKSSIGQYDTKLVVERVLGEYLKV